MPELEPYDLTEEQAHSLTAKIREKVSEIWPLIIEAYERRAWIALGLSSWGEYCDVHLRGMTPAIDRVERRDRVLEMSGVGMSNRAIGAAIGIDEGTVRNDLRPSAENSADDQQRSAPLWDTLEARTAEIVSCGQGHMAARTTFEDVDGCPYCIHTPGERQAALRAVDAFEAHRAQARKDHEHAERVSGALRRWIAYCNQGLVGQGLREQYARIYDDRLGDSPDFPVNANTIRIAGEALLDLANVWDEVRS